MSGDYVCRVCEATEDLEILFKKENESLIEMLKTILDVPVKPDDYLPQCICASCIKRLHRAYKFKLKFLETDKKLRSTLLLDADQSSVQQPDNAFIEDIPINNDASECPAAEGDGLVSEIVKEEVLFEAEDAEHASPNPTVSANDVESPEIPTRKRKAPEDVVADESIGGATDATSETSNQKPTPGKRVLRGKRSIK